MDDKPFHSDTISKNNNWSTESFISIGIIKNELDYDSAKLDRFADAIRGMRIQGSWERGELIDLFNEMIPEFNHKETGKFLDGRM